MSIKGVKLEIGNHYLWSGTIDSMNGISWKDCRCYIENIIGDNITIVDRNKNTWSAKQLIQNNIEFKKILK